MDSRTRFIADSRCFSGVCQTIMSDGLHSDSSGETLEELRIRKDNPYITALSPRQMEKRMRLYRQALCAPFEEITKKEYLERLNVLPPIRKREDSFFLSEPTGRILLYTGKPVLQGNPVRLHTASHTGQGSGPAHGTDTAEGFPPQREGYTGR